MLISTENAIISKEILGDLLSEMIRNNCSEEQFKQVFESLGCEVKFGVKV